MGALGFPIMGNRREGHGNFYPILKRGIPGLIIPQKNQRVYFGPFSVFLEKGFEVFWSGKNLIMCSTLGKKEEGGRGKPKGGWLFFTPKNCTFSLGGPAGTFISLNFFGPK